MRRELARARAARCSASAQPPGISLRLALALHTQLPPIAIQVMEPKTHVRRARTLRPDFVARIFEIDSLFPQVGQRFLQCRHAREVKRHVSECARRRLPLLQGDRDIVIPDRDAALEFELLFQAQRAREPFRTPLRTAHRQSEVTDHSQRKWNFHARTVNGLRARRAEKSRQSADAQPRAEGGEKKELVSRLERLTNSK